MCKGYAVWSINSMLASLNSYFAFLGRQELKIKPIRLQQQIFRPEEKEMTRQEYKRLCETAMTSDNQSPEKISEISTPPYTRFFTISVQGLRCYSAITLEVL